jgi:hypothetical protein
MYNNFSGIAQHLPKSRYETSLGTVCTKVVYPNKNCFGCKLQGKLRKHNILFDLYALYTVLRFLRANKRKQTNKLLRPTHMSYRYMSWSNLMRVVLALFWKSQLFMCVHIYTWPGLENREYGRRDPSCWPRGTLYLQKLALTSPTSGGLSVGIFRSRTKGTELVIYIYITSVIAIYIYIYSKARSCFY